MSGGRSRVTGGRSRLGGGRSRFKSGGSRMRQSKVRGIKGATSKNSDGRKEPIIINGILVNPKPLEFPKIQDQDSSNIVDENMDKSMPQGSSILESSLKSPSNSIDKSSDSAMKRSESNYGLDESSMA